MNERSDPPAVDTSGLLVGLAVGVPATIAIGAVMAVFRSLFNTTNAALVLVIIVVAIAVLGGRIAGIVTALAAVLVFDFFHTEPYLSLSINSRDDLETTVLLLVVGVVVGTIATAGRQARRREGAAQSEIHRIHRVAEAAASGRDATDVIRVAQEELRSLLALRESRFEASPFPDGTRLPRLGRNGAIELQAQMRYAVRDDGRRGFELPPQGAELPVLARGQQIGRFVLVPTPGEAVTLEERMVAVAIADQVAAVWLPTS